MEHLTVPRIILSGIKGEVGKALLGIGITQELRKQGVGVSSVVLGPNLLQAILYKRMSGRYVRCLDMRLLSAAQNMLSLYFAGIGSDLVLIHGNAGLFDKSCDGVLCGSDSEFAALTRSPVLLVVDARGFGASLSALLKGYCISAHGFEIAGAIFNRYGASAQSRDELSFVLQEAGLPWPIGLVPELKQPSPLPERGISEAINCTSLPMQFFIELGQAVQEHIQLERIKTLAEQAANIRLAEFARETIERRCRIAVSDDSCFNLCFQDNLDLLRYFGAELIKFSPLADSSLPKRCSGLYLSGAFLADYGSELSNNHSIKNSIKEFAARGGVVYAEGGGAAFLCEKFRCAKDAPVYEGVGLIPGTAHWNKAGALQYQESVTIEESILGGSGLIVKGVSNGEWKLSGADSVVKALRVNRGSGAVLHEGYSPGAQILGTFIFQHMGSNPELARNIVDAAEVTQKSMA